MKSANKADLSQLIENAIIHPDLILMAGRAYSASCCG